jgi:hypothetical protein
MAALRVYRMSRDTLHRLAMRDRLLWELGLTHAEIEQATRPRWDRF